MKQEQIVDLLSLLPEQIKDLINKLNYALQVVENRKNTPSKVAHNENNKVMCPFCKSNHIVKNGKNKSKVQTYKCKACNKRFNDLTGTLFYRSKLNINQMEKLLNCIIDKNTIREIASILNVNIKTAFIYRQKILSALSLINDVQILDGEIEADEYHISINLKGTKKKDMPRASKPRESHGGSKRGISNHQVCIATAIDEHDTIYYKIVGTGHITSDSVKSTFKNKITNNSKFITDCNSSYESFFNENNIPYEQVKSETHMNSNGYTLSNINSLHSDFKDFLTKFRGVSTKHLKGYLGWFAYIKKLNYTVEFLKRKSVFFHNIFIKNTDITTNNMYDNTSGIDFFKVYEEYNYHA